MPRKNRPRCRIQRCKPRPIYDDLCKSHLVAQMDMWARERVLTRDERTCQSGRPAHVGVIQWCHIISRRYFATRWLDEGAIAMCAGCHTYFTVRPDAWTAWCLRNVLNYEELLRRAVDTQHTSLIDEYDRLKGLLPDPR